MDLTLPLLFCKKLRSYFSKHYSGAYIIGTLYSDNVNIIYFPLSTVELKAKMLKIAIIYNIHENRFEVWLSAQNKKIQKEYWLKFKDSDWNAYSIPESIEKTFSITENIIINNPDFKKEDSLILLIEKNVMEFVDEIKAALLQ